MLQRILSVLQRGRCYSVSLLQWVHMWLFYCNLCVVGVTQHEYVTVPGRDCYRVHICDCYSASLLQRNLPLQYVYNLCLLQRCNCYTVHICDCYSASLLHSTNMWLLQRVIVTAQSIYVRSNDYWGVEVVISSHLQERIHSYIYIHFYIGCNGN